MAISERHSLGTLYKVNVSLTLRGTEKCPPCDTHWKSSNLAYISSPYISLLWGEKGHILGSYLWQLHGLGPYKIRCAQTESRNTGIKPKFNNIQKCFELRRKSTQCLQLVRKSIHLPKWIIRHEQNASAIRISTQLSETAQDCPVSVRMRAERAHVYTLCSR